jgi:hypothetical protein
MLYNIKGMASGEFNISRSIDESRESAFYPNGTGPWNVGSFSFKEVSQMAADSGWRLHDGRQVSDFPDFREIPQILAEEHAQRWADQTRSKTPESTFEEATAVALVADAYAIFDLAPMHPLGLPGTVQEARRKAINLHNGAKTWGEAIDQHGFRIEPISMEGLKALRRQAEDQLRKQLHQLPQRLSALLTGSNCYPATISCLNLPKDQDPGGLKN